MKALNPNAIALITTFSALSSFAQSAELPQVQELAAPVEPGAQPIASFVYKNAANNSIWSDEEYARQLPSLSEAAKSLLKATAIRDNAVSLVIPRTGVIRPGDRAVFSIYAPMQKVNGALSLAGLVSQSRVNDSVVTLAQTVSALATRQVNAELAYSVKADSRSKFDSAIAYRWSPGGDSDKSGVVVSVRYSIKF